MDEATEGDLDPTDQAALETLVHTATRRFGAALRSLSNADRGEALADARAAAVEAALMYAPASARTTKWKTAANAANYEVRRYLEARRRVLPASALMSVDDGSSDDALDRAMAASEDDSADDAGTSAADVAQYARSRGITFDVADRQIDAQIEAAEAAEREADARDDELREGRGTSVDELILTVPELTPERLLAETGARLSSEGIRKRRLRLRRGESFHD